MMLLRLIPILLLAGGIACAQKPVPILFDTDIGDDIDDALALALALQSPELDVRGVTTVIDDVELRTRLAWKELGIYGRRDIPLATGAPEPLLDKIRNNRSRQYEVLTPADVFPPAARKHAAEFIVETLMASPDKITIVPVGPLTNIALALKTEPRIRQKIERIVLMGGAFFPPRAEYNILRDRVAAEIVFQSGVPITAVGLDVTMKCKLRGRGSRTAAGGKESRVAVRGPADRVVAERQAGRLSDAARSLGHGHRAAFNADRNAVGRGRGGDRESADLRHHGVHSGGPAERTGDHPGRPRCERAGVSGPLRDASFGSTARRR